MAGLTDLNQSLYELYIARIYPVLANNDPLYQNVLKKAGMGWTGTGVPPAHRQAFEGEMRLQAWLGAQKISDAKSLAPGSVRARLLAGPTTLYRIADSRWTQSPPGIWWFSEKVAQRCRDEAGADPQKRLAWLRNVLAVCFNWSQFDRIERLSLHAGESIPSVIGTGLEMPHYKLAISYAEGTIERAPADYWKKKGQILLGGELQTILPWIPVHRVSATSSL
jgi:hypothetical protein